MREYLHKYHSLPKWIIGLGLLAYYLMVVLPHEWVGKIIAGIFNSLERQQYNLVILIVSLAILGLFLSQFFRGSKLNHRSRWYWLYLAATLAFAGVSYNILFTLNIEFVHFLQYGVFVLICFPLCRSFYETWMWACLAGVLDEFYQYVILAPARTHYFDFNDVIINMIGAALGILLLKSYGYTTTGQDWKKYFLRLQGMTLIGLSLMIVLLFQTGLMSVHPSENSVFVLMKKSYPGFWSTVPPRVVLHIIKPLEGLLLVLFLSVLYIKFDE